MVGFIIRRLLWTIPVLLLVILMTFLMMRHIQGNPFRHSERAVSPEVQANLERKFNLDKPWYVQYALYVKGVATFDLGPSLVLRSQSVNDIVKEHFPKSLELGFLAMLFAIVFGIPLGVIAALRPNTVFDYTAMFFSNVGFAVPSFLIATLLIYFFALKWGDITGIPTSGWTTWQSKILPVIALGLGPMAYFARLVRGTMLETLQQDYVRTAKAKGLSSRRILFVHVLKNSLTPAVTAAGPLLGFLITGLVHHRVHLRDPGDRQVLHHGRLLEGLLRRDGPDGPAVGDRRAREHGRGHPLRRPRPANARGPHLMVVSPQEQRMRSPDPAHAGDFQVAGAGTPIRQSSLWRDARRRYMRNKGALIAGSIFLLVLAYCIIVPIVSPYDPDAVNFDERYLPPSLSHPFGTDAFGRDLFTRVALGGRISIMIGFAATFVILVIGLTYGSLSGFVGGWLDNAMMRFLDALYGLPYLPFAIITLAIVGTVNPLTMVIALSIASWFTAARIVRGQIITLKENDYVRAATAVGARWYRVLARHLVPNTLGVLIIAIFLELPGVILGEAFLSFIGLGINPPDASWGSMAQEGRQVYRTHPSLILIPSVAIATLVLCANFIADGLRDALDPRTKET